MPPETFAILIGAMKAGTTTLFHRLAQHPQIAPSRRKEPDFFSQDAWPRSLADYQTLWPDWDPDEHHVALEASTTYTKRPRRPAIAPRVAQLVDEHGIDVRFIYSLRDPLDRIRSHMTHALAGNDPDAHHLAGIRRGSVEGHTLEVSMYARQLDPYVEHFDRDRIHLVRFEALVEDPDPVLASIARFLDVDLDRLPQDHAQLNPTVGKYEKSLLWQLAEDAGLGKATDLLPAPIRERLRETLGDEIEAKIEIGQARRAFLLDALHRDLERLRDEHGVDLSGWTLPDGLDPAP